MLHLTFLFEFNWNVQATYIKLSQMHAEYKRSEKTFSVHASSFLICFYVRSNFRFCFDRKKLRSGSFDRCLCQIIFIIISFCWLKSSTCSWLATFVGRKWFDVFRGICWSTQHIKLRFSFAIHLEEFIIFNVKRSFFSPQKTGFPTTAATTF